jgi:hypothetical protein
MQITEVDAITNESIDREMTEDELKSFAEHKKEVELKAAAEKKKAVAKSLVLERLGITAEEAALLLQ